MKTRRRAHCPDELVVTPAVRSRLRRRRVDVDEGLLEALDLRAVAAAGRGPAGHDGLAAIWMRTGMAERVRPGPHSPTAFDIAATAWACIVSETCE